MTLREQILKKLDEAIEHANKSDAQFYYPSGMSERQTLAALRRQVEKHKEVELKITHFHDKPICGICENPPKGCAICKTPFPCETQTEVAEDLRIEVGK